MGRLGLLLSEGENYKLANWIDTNLEIKSMELRKIPNKNFWSVVVKTGGGAGTGIVVEWMQIYTYLDNQLKLTWKGLLSSSSQIIGEKSHIEENNYSIYFLDYDRDGDLEIFQEGTEKEGEKYDERGNLIPTRENFVKKLFKWNYNIHQFEEISEK